MAVEVDGVSRHIRDLRPAVRSEECGERSSREGEQMAVTVSSSSGGG